MFYEVVDRKLIEQVEAWFEKRHLAEQAFLRLSRRAGGSRNRYATGEGFGGRTFAFVFNREPDREHWKKGRGVESWLPKLSSNTGKEIQDEVDAIQLAGGTRGDLSRLFGVGDFWKQAGVERVKGRWFVIVEKGWKFSKKGLKRISDVELEALRGE